MRSGGKCMKCGGTATYRLGGVIQYFTDGGKISNTKPGSAGAGAGGGGGRLDAAGAGGGLGERDNALRMKLDRIKSANTKDDIIKLGKELGMEEEEQSPVMRALQYKTSILHSDIASATNDGKPNSGNNSSEKIIAGIKNSVKGDDKSMLSYVLGESPDYSYSNPSNSLGSGAGSSGGASSSEDKSLPNWGRAKTQQEILNKLIKEDKSIEKSGALVEDDIIGPKTIEAMRKYEANGSYKRPVLFSDENLAQYKKNVEGMNKTKDTEKKSTLVNPTSVTQQQVAKTPVTKVTKDSNADKAKTPVTTDSNEYIFDDSYELEYLRLKEKTDDAIYAQQISPNLMSGVRLDHAKNKEYEHMKSEPKRFPDAKKEIAQDRVDDVMLYYAKKEAEAKAEAKTPVTKASRAQAKALEAKALEAKANTPVNKAIEAITLALEGKDKAKPPVTKGSKNSNLLEVFNPIGRGMKSILSGFGEGAEYAFNTVNNFAQNLSKPANYNAPKEGSMSPSFKESTKPQGTDKQQRSASLYQDKLNSFRERGMNDLTIEEKNLAKDLSEYTKGQPETAAMKKWLNDYEKD